ncbi:hypothetical protein M6B38_389675 [Iris pallida]|uniref:Uncharacterized protein n=1 Tax=Iris pallida TaxID=29817 RepID=A0AAX6G0K2_IRIPA|nr:hypothetical protein M6B38_389675 [Iris pallida]
MPNQLAPDKVDIQIFCPLLTTLSKASTFYGSCSFTLFMYFSCDTISCTFVLHVLFYLYLGWKNILAI